MHDEVVAGQVLAGKYRVERVLGQGGMGIVVAAQHLQLDERVAMKFMLRQAMRDPESVARFTREARAAVKIKSEHVARVSDVGVLENGSPYMVMEYLDGADLSDWLKQHGQLPVEQAVDFVLQASEAIAEAHALGIVHRDLKPANLFVIRRPDGVLSVKVLDFGISKVTGLSSSSPEFGMTKTSAVMGSPFYMSPEQMRTAKDVDARGDIWALGIILYELLSGVTPFTSETFPDLVLKIATEPPAPLRNRAPDAPLGLEAVIFRCLEKDPNKRFATIGDLAIALADFAPRRSRQSVERISGVLREAGISDRAPAMSRSYGSNVADAETGASWGKTTPARSSAKGALLLLGAGLALAVAAAAGYAVLRSSAPLALSSQPMTAALPPIVTAIAPLATPPKIAAAPEQAASPTSAALPAASASKLVHETNVTPAARTPPAAVKPKALPAKPTDVYGDR